MRHVDSDEVFPLTALVTAAALLLSLPHGPWRHVHAHGHDEHHIATAFHVHPAPGSVMPSWRAHGPDEDARSIASLQVTAHAGRSGQAVALVPAVASLHAPSPGWVSLTGAPSRGHDPPAHAASRPRAPPGRPA